MRGLDEEVMMNRKKLVVENMARVGYQTMHDSRWDNPEMDPIELALWRTIAANMLYEVRRTWEEAKLRRLDED